jgi:hypothetical protein
VLSGCRVGPGPKASTGCHNGQRAIGRSRSPARHRRVDQDQVRAVEVFVETLAEAGDESWRDSSMDHKRVNRSSFEREQRRLDVCLIGDHDQGELHGPACYCGIRSDLRLCPWNRARGRHEGVESLGGDVEADDGEGSTKERDGHGVAHDTEAEEGSGRDGEDVVGVIY